LGIGGYNYGVVQRSCRVVLLLWGIISLVSCSKSVDLAGKQCPCTSGYVCDEATNTCVRPSDAGVLDASVPDADASIDDNPVMFLAAGGKHTCAVFTDGSLKCWGANNAGQLGYGVSPDIGDDETPASKPFVDVGGKVTQVVASGDRTCALLDNGTFKCWGAAFNVYDNVPADAPAIDFGTKVVQLAAGGAHACALLADDSVHCWGAAAYGQLGYGNTTAIDYDDLPEDSGPVSVGADVIRIAAGVNHTCALMDDGRVRCWGENYRGALGYKNALNIGDDELPSEAGPVPLLYNGTLNVEQLPADDIVSRDRHTCTRHGGKAVCWGANSTDKIPGTAAGALGLGHTNDVGDNEYPSTDTGINTGAVVMQLATGQEHTCALLEGGQVLCWGGGVFGALGYGDNLNIGDDELPVSVDPVSVGGEASQVVTGDEHTCALLVNGDVRCWGAGQNGRLGYGNENSIGVGERPSDVGPVQLK
jgi:alpha-tubulin suppressor-like RCC1 family protein